MLSILIFGGFANILGSEFSSYDRRTGLGLFLKLIRPNRAHAELTYTFGIPHPYDLIKRSVPILSDLCDGRKCTPVNLKYYVKTGSVSKCGVPREPTVTFTLIFTSSPKKLAPRRSQYEFNGTRKFLRPLSHFMAPIFALELANLWPTLAWDPKIKGGKLVIICPFWRLTHVFLRTQTSTFEHAIIAKWTLRLLIT